MTTSGTYAFNPSFSALSIYAFNLCGIRSTSLLAEHMESARMAAGLLQARWSSQGVNLWAVDLQTVSLVAGTSTYNVPTNTIVMLDAYITVDNGSATQDRIIMPISRTEYASYSNKEQQGFPTVFWFDRLLAPTVTLWPVPDGSQDLLNYYRLREIQDATLTGGTTLEMNQYFLEAFALGLAARLAMIWAADKAMVLKAAADEAYEIAAVQNIETANLYLSPQISSYFR